MRVNIRFLVLSFKLLLVAACPAFGQNYNLQTLEQAHAMFRSATNSAMYAEAARQYEFLVAEEGVRNGHLFYTLGNCWFMAGDAGRAILNYRRAEELMPNNADLRHNLTAARGLRTDLIPEKEPHPLAVRLLGWHINTPTTLRWRLFAACWLLFWSAWFWTTRSAKKEPRITAVATGIFSAVLLASLLTETVQARKAQPGVVTAREVLARKGDGDIYAPAFLEPLHSGTEFQTLSVRGQWRHIRLADGQTCWIPMNAGDAVVLD